MTDGSVRISLTHCSQVFQVCKKWSDCGTYGKSVSGFVSNDTLFHNGCRDRIFLPAVYRFYPFCTSLPAFLAVCVLEVSHLERGAHYSFDLRLPYG